MEHKMEFKSRCEAARKIFLEAIAHHGASRGNYKEAILNYNKACNQAINDYQEAIEESFEKVCKEALSDFNKTCKDALPTCLSTNADKGDIE